MTLFHAWAVWIGEGEALTIRLPGMVKNGEPQSYGSTRYVFEATAEPPSPGCPKARVEHPDHLAFFQADPHYLLVVPKAEADQARDAIRAHQHAEDSSHARWAAKMAEWS